MVRCERPRARGGEAGTSWRINRTHTTARVLRSYDFVAPPLGPSGLTPSTIDFAVGAL